MTSSGKPFSRPRTGKPYTPAGEGHGAPRDPKKQWGPQGDDTPRPPRKAWNPKGPADGEGAPRPEKKKWEPAFDGAPRRDAEPQYKVRSDKGEKLGAQPAAVTDKPKKPKTKTKDIGKPKYKNRPNANQHTGDAPRKKPKSLPQD